MGGSGQNPYSLSSERLLPREEKVLVSEKQKQRVIGIPKEDSVHEHRVALIPHSIRTIVGKGHRVIVERGAGKDSNYDDHEYSEAGAEIVDDKKSVFEANMIAKVSPPTLDEIDFLSPGQIIISPLQIPIITDEYIDAMLDKRVIAIAMEYLQTRDGTFPLVRILSEIAGYSAVLTAAELLSNTRGGRGTLLGGVSGVPPGKVIILGAGVVGEYATRAALGLGASVRIFDDDMHKLMRIQQMLGRPLHTSSLNSAYLEYQLTSADVVIGAIHSKTGRTNIVVTEEMVMKMKPGAVIVDVSIDQGGCFETSEVTSHAHPTFIKHDVIHYCVPNIASKVSRTASVAMSNTITPILLETGEAGSFDQLLYDNAGLRNGVYTYKGKLTNEYLSQRFGKKFTDLNLLLTSGL
ncbi:MAG: alanine dehydrogenase [Saprospiraceae bacterium]|nr:alanine dehydrogenase [Saprospiraceae bacterium]